MYALKPSCSIASGFFGIFSGRHVHAGAAIQTDAVANSPGGRVRDRIRLYGSAGMYMPPGRYAEEAAAIAQLGFRAYKMRPALGPEKDLETVRLMREAVGPTFDLMVDAHTWWRMGDRSYDKTRWNDWRRRWRNTTSPGSRSRCRPTIMKPICG